MSSGDGSRGGLNKQIVGDIEIPYTSKEEQDKIGECFNNLDHLITLHQKKCFEWKKSEFSRVSISWEQRKFYEWGTFYYGHSCPKWSVTEDAKIPCIRYGELYTKFGAKIDRIYSYTNMPPEKLRFSTGKEVLIPRVGEDPWDYNHCTWLSLKDVAIGEMISVFNTDQDPLFSATMFNATLQKEFAVRVEGGSVTNLYFEKLKNIDVSYPSLPEQKKIAAYFDTLDHLITLHQRKLELLKRLRNSLINRCFTGEKITMSKLILYHGSPNRVIVPKFGFGEDRHDYGRGFYLTENLELAKEWAVCRPDETNGWAHKYELEMDGLNILDFQKYDVLSWLAELMKHRDAADSRRYKMLAQKFIEKYGIDTCGYDVITGWRANASYFYIAKEFVRDNIDIEILEELLSLGGLGIQFCIKSERAFAQLSEVEQDIMSVDYSEFNDRYNERDINARTKMRALVDSDANKVTHVFSTLFER